MSDLRTAARSISRLLGDAFEQLSELVQTEIRLARAELADKAARAGIGLGMVVGGVLLMVPALVLCVVARAIFATQKGISPFPTHFLWGFIAFAASAGLVFAALPRLKPGSLTPD